MRESNKKSTEYISPTAEFTGFVWYTAKLAPKQLQTLFGRIIYYCTKPIDKFIEVISGGLAMRNFLLARHLSMDAIIRQILTDEKVAAVIEIAAGLSGRGLRISKAFPDIDYIETDLTHVIALKQERIALLPTTRPENLDFAEIDILNERGPQSIKDFLSNKKYKHVLIVSEGLLGYFSQQQIRQCFSNIWQGKSKSRKVTYLTELHFDNELRHWIFRFFKKCIETFVKRKLNLPLASQDEAVQIIEEFKPRYYDFLTPENVSHQTKIKKPERYRFIKFLKVRF